MSEKAQNYSFNFDNNLLTLKGIKQVVEIGEKQAVFKLDGKILTVKGNGLNVVRLDREQGNVALEVATLLSISLRQGGLSLKGLFR